jgi:hypothetical protein
LQCPALTTQARARPTPTPPPKTLKVRIGGGVYPDIKERDYLSAKGEYRIDAEGNPIMLKSLMYKLSYYE